MHNTLCHICNRTICLRNSRFVICLFNRQRILTTGNKYHPYKYDLLKLYGGCPRKVQLIFIYNFSIELRPNQINCFGNGGNLSFIRLRNNT